MSGPTPAPPAEEVVLVPEPSIERSPDTREGGPSRAREATIGSIRYRSGYKYQLVEPYACRVAVLPEQDVDTEFIRLERDGHLLVKRGYAWDGPSGPTLDTRNFMRGSLVHDALYQLMRQEHLSFVRWREVADRELRRMCLEDGMSRLRAWWVYRAVRIGGGPSASPESAKPIRVAP